MWKRHIDQLTQMDDSPQQEQPTNRDKETMIRFPQVKQLMIQS